jgi:uncharacterized membrane protein YfcA
MESLPEISLYFVLVTFAASFAACFFSSLSGGGAGLILLPVLLFTGLPFINALASHKLAVGFIGIGATARFVRERLIDWRVFWWTAIVGLPLVVLGTRFAAAMPGAVMKPLVGGVIIAMVLISLIPKKTKAELGPALLNSRLLITGSLLFVPAAFYSGWISAGSGVFTTFIYLWLLRYDQLHATAMTLSANGIFWNGVGAIAHILMGHVIWPLAPGLILGAVLGSYLGASVGIRKGNRFLRIMFLGTATVTGVILLFPAVVGLFQ